MNTGADFCTRWHDKQNYKRCKTIFVIHKKTINLFVLNNVDMINDQKYRRIMSTAGQIRHVKELGSSEINLSPDSFFCLRSIPLCNFLCIPDDMFSCWE